MTANAKADLKNVKNYVEQENPAAAKALVGDLVKKLFSLAAAGVEGASRDWVSTGLRAFPYRQRCFYFRVMDDKLYLVRVLHGKQDVSREDFPKVAKDSRD